MKFKGSISITTNCAGNLIVNAEGTGMNGQAESRKTMVVKH